MYDIQSFNLMELVFLKDLESNKLVFETKAKELGMAKVNIFLKQFLYIVLIVWKWRLFCNVF